MIRFGNFQVLKSRRQLLRDGEALALRERAFEVLLALVEQPGTIVTKRELCRRAWPERDVDENNLQVEILGLRKLIGKRAIVTASGRGYQFALRVVTTADPDSAGPVSRLIGRDDDLKAIEAALAPGVLVTLTGEGGIGKSRTAAALAAHLEAAAPGTACVVAFDAALEDVPAQRVIADALHLPEAAGRESVAALCLALQTRRLLLVLDDCDRMVQEVAELASMVRERCPGVSLLVTSREVLRVPGERVVRLGPLVLGGESDAGALFRECGFASGADDSRSDADRATIVEIIRRLEGNPLAIRLAAQRATAIGIDSLHQRLAERLDLLEDVETGAPARQRSLRAALVFSYERFSRLEQRVFCDLAALGQPFTLERFLALERSSPLDPWDAMEALTRLVEKSLVGIDQSDPPNYRLSETMLLYAQEMRERHKTKYNRAPRHVRP